MDRKTPKVIIRAMIDMVKRERLFSKETVVLNWRGSETLKFGIKQVRKKGQISTVNR